MTSRGIVLSLEDGLSGKKKNQRLDIYYISGPNIIASQRTTTGQKLGIAFHKYSITGQNLF